MCTSWPGRSVSSSVLVAKDSHCSIPRPLLRPSTCRRSRTWNPSSPDFWSLCLRLRLCPRAARSSTGRAKQWDRDTNPRTPAAPLAVDTLDPPRSALVPPPLVPPAVDHAAPPTSPGRHCPAGGRLLDAAQRWPDNHARHDILSSRRSRPPTSRLDSRRPAGHPAPQCACDPVRLAAPFRDQLPGHFAALAAIELPRRRRPGLG